MDAWEWISLQTIIFFICSLSSVWSKTCIDEVEEGNSPWSPMDREKERDRITMLSLTNHLDTAVKQFNTQQGSNYKLAMDKTIRAPKIVEAYRKVWNLIKAYVTS